jgi:hypothetical protein
MNYLPLAPIDIKSLRTFSNERDILHDLFVYLDYAGEHSIKRMTRTNEIPRTDQQRMAKLLGGLAFDPKQDEIDASQWIDFIDSLAYRLHLVNYDIKGVYRGMNSSEPSFIENYVTVTEAQLREFLELTPVEQEKRILETLKDPKSLSQFQHNEYNEFFLTSVLGELDPFDARGSAIGVIPTLKFPNIRQFLLDLLVQCTPEVWYSTESWVQYLKTNFPYFLIPEKIQPDRWGKIGGRYDNFHEIKNFTTYDTATIPENAPDAFERVEGRYVERFLEYLPLLMRFVDVAYDPEEYTGSSPSRGMLKAFRVNERLQRVMRGEKTPPRVTVQPNFDVVIESDFYPAKLIQQIAALSEPVSNPLTGSTYVGIFQLKKAQVAQAQVRQPDLDVIALLKELSGRDLPPNLQTELEEWSGHADQFTLYEGFGLLESMDEVPQVDQFTAERISPNFHLVRNAKALYQNLESKGCVPLRVEHAPAGFFPLPETVHSLFPKEAVEEEPETVTQIKISRIISITIKFPDEGSLDAFRKMLAELRCPFQSDSKLRTLTFDQQNQAKFDEAVQRLRDVYAVEIE